MVVATDEFNYLFKIVLIGDSAVGKSNILSQLVNKEPLANSKPTIGVEFGTKTFKFNKSVVRAQIWDTAGQERYHAITAAYYRGSYGAVIVYDITQKNSLDNAINTWLKTLKKSTEPGMPIMLLGNKTDLSSKRCIQEKEGKEAAISNGLGFYETSAISGENIQKAFEIFIEEIYKNEQIKEKNKPKAKIRREDLIGENLQKNLSKNKKSGCC